MAAANFSMYLRLEEVLEEDDLLDDEEEEGLYDAASTAIPAGLPPETWGEAIKVSEVVANSEQ